MISGVHGAAPVPFERPDPAGAAPVRAHVTGTVAAVRATVGQEVAAGDTVIVLSAMKMETGIHADRDAVVAAVHVSPGGQIDAKDLLVELE